MSNTDFLKKRLSELDDEAFTEVIGDQIERVVETEQAPNDEIVHIIDFEDEIKQEYEHWGKVRGLLTGDLVLDKKLGGMDNGHVILIGGETSHGKSAFAANIAVNVSKQVGVLFITLEMMIRQIGSRIMHLNGGNLDGLDMMFQQKPRINYKDLKPLITKAIDQGGIKMVVIDYLQYLGRGMKNEEVAIMSKEIKTLATEFNIPIIVIVSLRKSEGGKAKRKWTDIEIEDFMGTGAIGYDCDVAMVVSRKDLSDNYDDDHIYLKVLKTRNSHLDYNKRYLMFDWDATKITGGAVIQNGTINNDGFIEAE